MLNGTSEKRSPTTPMAHHHCVFVNRFGPRRRPTVFDFAMSRAKILQCCAGVAIDARPCEPILMGFYAPADDGPPPPRRANCTGRGSGGGGRGYGPDPYPAQRLRQPPTGSRLCTDNYYYYILHERTISPADTAQTRVQTRAHAAPPTVPPTPLAVTDVAIPGGTSAGRTPIDSIEFICDSSADPVCRCPSSTPVDPAVCCSRQPSVRTVIIGYR